MCPCRCNHKVIASFLEIKRSKPLLGEPIVISIFLSALVLGLLFNAAPGAVFAETVKVGVTGGFRPALAVQIGSLAGDALWAILGLAGVGMTLQIEALRLPLGVAGVIYLLWLSYDSWRAAGQEMGEFTNGADTQTKALRSGVLLSITNPQNIAYWAALGSALGAIGVSDPTSVHYAVFFCGFMVSSFIWCFACAALVDRSFRHAGAKWAKLTYKACALAFLVLALSSTRNIVGSFPKDRSEAEVSQRIRLPRPEQSSHIPT